MIIIDNDLYRIELRNSMIHIGAIGINMFKNLYPSNYPYGMPYKNCIHFTQIEELKERLKKDEYLELEKIIFEKKI